jgi:hypothetical protein
MRLCNKNTLVYGSGIRDRNQNIKNGIIKCVRGPITRQRLLELKCECPPIYGDPALLLKYYYQPKDKIIKYKLGIIPHCTEYTTIYEKYKEINDIVVIDLRTKDIEHIIDLICQCQCTVSSSLHGIIFSNAYDIPVRWIKFSNNITGDGTKFNDHFKAIGRNNEQCINALGFKFIPVDELIKQVLPYTIKIDLDYLKETMFFDENGIRKHVRYLFS